MIDAPPAWGGTPDAAPDFAWVPLNTIVERPIVWVDYPFLQGSAFHLLAGIKNAGKGTLLAHEAARMTRGELGPKRRVLWAALGEDSYSVDVRPRVRAAGGDVSKVDVLQGYGFTLPDHGQVLEDAIREREAGMVVIDPLGGVMPGGKSTNDDSHVRPVLQALNYMADATDTIILGVRHISIKSERRQQGALASILGSSDWVNIPRAVLALVHDDVDANMRHLFTITGNRGPSDQAGVMCSIEGVTLDGHQHPVTTMRIIGESNKDPDELLAVKRTRRTSRSDAAKVVLVNVLSEVEGASMESDLLDAEVAHRTGLSARTVRNLRMEMREQGFVRAAPVKDADDKVQHWMTILTLAGARLSSERQERLVAPTPLASASHLTSAASPESLLKERDTRFQDSGDLQGFSADPQSPARDSGSVQGFSLNGAASPRVPGAPRVPTLPFSGDSGSLQGLSESSAQPSSTSVQSSWPEWERAWHEREETPQ